MFSLHSIKSLSFCLSIFNFIYIYETGLKDTILNGVPDWMYAYEKDLHGDTLAFSPTGKYLSYLSFNITDVKSYR